MEKVIYIWWGDWWGHGDWQIASSPNMREIARKELDFNIKHQLETPKR